MGTHLDRPLLTDRHFDIVSQTSAHFGDYLSQVHQIDEEETFGVMAAREGLRADDARQIRWDERRGSAAVNKPKQPSGRRAVRSTAARNETDGSEYDEEDERSEDYEEKKREQEREKTRMMRRRRSATKDDNAEEDEEEEERPERTWRKSSVKDHDVDEEGTQRTRKKGRAKAKESDETESEEKEKEKPWRKSKPRFDESDED